MPLFFNGQTTQIFIHSSMLLLFPLTAHSTLVQDISQVTKQLHLFCQSIHLSCLLLHLHCTSTPDTFSALIFNQYIEGPQLWTHGTIPSATQVHMIELKPHSTPTDTGMNINRGIWVLPNEVKHVCHEPKKTRMQTVNMNVLRNNFVFSIKVI